MPGTDDDNTATELALALTLLMRRMRSANPSETDELSWTQKAVLIRLDETGPATTAELARGQGVKPQSMGAIVAALEVMGLVERKPHPTDGRQVNLALTTKGARMRRDTRAAKQTWLAGAIAQLDAKDRKSLSAVMPVIRRLAES